MKRLRNESGVALPIALGFVLVISIALVTVLSISSSSQRSSKFSKADQTAVAVGEAGLNHAESVLAKAANPSSPSALPGSGSPATITVDGGTARYWGSLDTAPDPDRWTVNAVSSVANPSDGSTVSHTVTAQFDVAVSVVGNEGWNYVFSDAAGCTYFPNTVTVYAPVYTKGDLCMKNSAAVLGPKVDVYGGIQLENTGRVGTSPSDASDPAVRSRLGCRNGSSGGFDVACSDATYRVYRSSYVNTVPALTKPPFDATKRNTAMPGPNQACTTSSGSVPSFTSTGQIDLLPASSYTCQVWSSPPSSGTLLGELSWNNTTKVLTVSGTIWFDGELFISNAQNGSYNGKASIYFNKKATIQNQAKLCAIAGCPTSGWDPNAELLLLVSAAPDVPGFVIQNEAQFQGAVYTVGGFKLQNEATMHGPVIASVLDIQNNGLPAGWPSLTSMLPGAPSNNGALIPVPGSWRG
jgi:Tfp pilus assembly protein PilX